MRDPHIGEDAELYALGSLDEVARARIDRHVAECDDCLRLLGEAEETVLALERQTALQQIPSGAKPAFLRRTTSPWWIALAVAAAFVLGFIIPHPQRPAQTPQLAMINSHFNHAQFAGAGPKAKVLYARDRTWYYVIVEGTHVYDVYGVHGGTAERLGSTAARGATSELFINPAPRFDRVELRDGTVTVEAAEIR
jgi:hypothetical protein